MGSVMCISYCLHDWRTIFIILFSSLRTLSNRIIQFTCNAVNTHLNHRRIFLFSTPYGVGSLLCMWNINYKPHWLAICCLSRIFYFYDGSKVCVCSALKMGSVMCISYCLHDWRTIFIILFSSFWTVDREKNKIF
jgi:hypothetical protein